MQDVSTALRVKAAKLRATALAHSQAASGALQQANLCEEAANEVTNIDPDHPVAKLLNYPILFPLNQ